MMLGMDLMVDKDMNCSFSLFLVDFAGHFACTKTLECDPYILISFHSFFLLMLLEANLYKLIFLIAIYLQTSKEKATNFFIFVMGRYNWVFGMAYDVTLLWSGLAARKYLDFTNKSSKKFNIKLITRNDQIIMTAGFF